MSTDDRTQADTRDDERYRAILVDFDGTLYRQTPVRVMMALELLMTGLGVIRPLRALRLEQERMRAAKVGVTQPADGPPDLSPYEVQLRSAARRSGVPLQRMRAIAEQWMIERPGKWLRPFARRSLIRTLQREQQRGLRVGIVSDYPARHKLEALRLPFVPDVVIASGEPGGPGRLKPDPEGYRLAADQLDIAPSACLVIGDRDDADGEAARRAGMGFWLIR